ncbi:methyl-accepting chemotaxis protein [Metabacillus malikii]|uniref:Methyl-accepting chemotaxis protein n=1 Tax=Metabacillus malikii TaxID=1504265 RepID=A0ABT9ZC65_9BACI|nr:methyl-accepting chemotaxis protein [Metabacillus malikii]MDQ0229854.1 methyl-accepting chemotaxis protein [Metabacillus malikii]
MKRIRNLTITKKFLIIIIISALTVCTVGLSGLNFIKMMADDSDVMYKENMVPLHDVMQIRINARASDAYTLELIVTKDNKRNTQLIDEITSAWEEIDELMTKIEQTNLTKEQNEVVAQYKEKVTLLNNSRDEVIDLALENKNEEAYALYKLHVEENRAAVNDLLKELQKSKLEFAKSINSQHHINTKLIVWTVIFNIIIGILLIIGISYLVARMIIKPIKEVKDLLVEAEQGDFTVEGTYQSKDELGELTESFNKMARKLKSVFQTVHHSSQQVATASEELSASAEQNSKASEHITHTVQELASGSEQQLDKVASSTNVMSDMSNYTRVISDNTEKITNDVIHASKMSLDGNEAIEKVNEQMNTIYHNVNSLSEAVKNLDKRSIEIGEITNVITGISAQTNLLALNAAIEAARAGEHGKGFAVVADEVRKLAEESSKSTEQIASLIQLIQLDTVQTLDTMKKATEEVNSGLQVVNIAGESFKNIEQAVTGVVSQIEDISEAIKKLVNGTDIVNKSIHNVSDVAKESAEITQNISAATEEQLASMEEISHSSQSLAQLADELQNILKQFKI